MKPFSAFQGQHLGISQERHAGQSTASNIKGSCLQHITLAIVNELIMASQGGHLRRTAGFHEGACHSQT
jgi:hypothetical protein